MRKIKSIHSSKCDYHKWNNKRWQWDFYISHNKFLNGDRFLLALFRSNDHFIFCEFWYKNLFQLLIPLKYKYNYYAL